MLTITQIKPPKWAQPADIEMIDLNLTQQVTLQSLSAKIEVIAKDAFTEYLKLAEREKHAFPVISKMTGDYYFNDARYELAENSCCRISIFACFLEYKYKENGPFPDYLGLEIGLLLNFINNEISVMYIDSSSI